MIIHSSHVEALSEFKVTDVKKIAGGVKCTIDGIDNYLKNKESVVDWFRNNSNNGIRHVATSRPYKNKVTLIIYLKDEETRNRA